MFFLQLLLLPATSPLKLKPRNCWIQIFNLELKDKAPSWLHSLHPTGCCLEPPRNIPIPDSTLCTEQGLEQPPEHCSPSASQEKCPHCHQEHNGLAHTKNWQEAPSLFLISATKTSYFWPRGRGRQQKTFITTLGLSPTCQDPGVSQYPLSVCAQISPVSI